MEHSLKIISFLHYIWCSHTTILIKFISKGIEREINSFGQIILYYIVNIFIVISNLGIMGVLFDFTFEYSL